jgi:hypothetical protein
MLSLTPNPQDLFMNVTTSRWIQRWAAGIVLCAGAVTFAPAFADVIVGTGKPSATTLGETTATHIRVDSQGSGHGLIVPYYTTQGDAATLLNVTNSDRANGKVVKLRIRGAGNGDVLLSMTLLLAPGDTWAAALQQRDPGPAVLFAQSSDGSCTLPKIASFASESLKTNRLGASYSPDALAAHTREGTVEYITMADIPAAAVYGPGKQSTSELFQAIKHVNGVAPCGNVLNRLQANLTDEGSAAALGLAAPTGGLSGRWIIINVPGSLTFSGAMHVVRAVDANGSDARANFVLFPQTDTVYPAAKVDGATADPLLRTNAYPGKGANGAPTQRATSEPAVRALHMDFPDFSTPYTLAPGQDAALAQAERFTRAMAIKSASNEYFTVPNAQGRTDWVLSLPARRFSVAVDQTTAEPRMLFSMVPSTGSQYFHDVNMRLSPQDHNQACIVLDYLPQATDRDGKVDTRNYFAQPPYYSTTCGAVSVQGFNSEVSTMSPLGASVTRPHLGTLVTDGPEGWASIDFFSVPTKLGMPVLAAAFSTAFNPAARPGVAANYGTNSEHWYTR